MLCFVLILQMLRYMVLFMCTLVLVNFQYLIQYWYIPYQIPEPLPIRTSRIRPLTSPVPRSHHRSWWSTKSWTSWRWRICCCASSISSSTCQTVRIHAPQQPRALSVYCRQWFWCSLSTFILNHLCNKGFFCVLYCNSVYI